MENVKYSKGKEAQSGVIFILNPYR